MAPQHGPNAKTEFLSAYGDIGMPHHKILRNVLDATCAIDWSTWSVPDDDDDGPIVTPYAFRAFRGAHNV